MNGAADSLSVRFLPILRISIVCSDCGAGVVGNCCCCTVGCTGCRLGKAAGLNPGSV